MKHKVHSLDSILTHNTNGLTPDISKKQMIALILDEFFRILNTEQVGTLAHNSIEGCERLKLEPIEYSYRYTMKETAAKKLREKVMKELRLQAPEL